MNTSLRILKKLVGFNFILVSLIKSPKCQQIQIGVCRGETISLSMKSTETKTVIVVEHTNSQQPSAFTSDITD